MTQALLYYVTAPDAETADRIAASLVEERLAACVNVLPGARSVYRWEGKIERGEEVVLIAKTARGRGAALVQRVIELHPFETPACVALPLDTDLSSGAFIRWIAEETARR